VLTDRRLNPPVDEPDLGPVTLPASPSAPLPLDRMVLDSDEPGNFEIFSIGLDGSDPVQLTDDPEYDSWWARPSPDRQRVLFTRTPAGVHDNARDGAFQKASLWVMNADGGEPTELLPPGSHGWNQQGHPEWSPDGEQLVMFGGTVTNPQIWITDDDGRNPRQLTDEGGTNIDPSWSPDGATIVYIGCPSRICLPSDQEVYVVPAEGGDRTRLTDDGVRDNDPYFSPDGSRIALLSQTAKPDNDRPAGSWNIRIMDADGSGLERLTDDDDVNSKPAWTPDGESIYFHRLVYGDGPFGIWAIDADGTNLRRITPPADAAYEYPQP